MLIPQAYFQQFTTKKYSKTNYLKRYLISNFITEITETISLIKPKTITELGCGEGFVCGWINKQFSQISITGLDINLKDLELLQNHFPNIKIQQANLENFDIAINTDLILCLEVLEHLIDPEKFLQQLSKTNCNNLIISVPWEPWFQLSNLFRGQNIKQLGDDPEHLHHWNKRQMFKLLKKYFTIHRQKISFPWQIYWLKNETPL